VAGGMGRMLAAHVDVHARTPLPPRLPAWLEHYNTGRPHQALGGQPPINRLSPML
jgi:transposase InsO family protein